MARSRPMGEVLAGRSSSPGGGEVLAGRFCRVLGGVLAGIDITRLCQPAPESQLLRQSLGIETVGVANMYANVTLCVASEPPVSLRVTWDHM